MGRHLAFLAYIVLPGMEYPPLFRDQKTGYIRSQDDDVESRFGARPDETEGIAPPLTSQTGSEGDDVVQMRHPIDVMDWSQPQEKYLPCSLRLRESWTRDGGATFIEEDRLGKPPGGSPVYSCRGQG